MSSTTSIPIDIFDETEDDEEDNDSMPDLEESMPDLEDTSQFAMVSPENGFDNQYERDDNVGWRIDYQIFNNHFQYKVRSASIYKDERFSDHAPLIIEYEHT